MSIHCLSCGSSALRISRFRWKDILPLMTLRYPMRCWVCRMRDYLPLLQILRSARFGLRRGRSLADLPKAQAE